MRPAAQEFLLAALTVAHGVHAKSRGGPGFYQGLKKALNEAGIRPAAKRSLRGRALRQMASEGTVTL